MSNRSIRRLAATGGAALLALSILGVYSRDGEPAAPVAMYGPAQSLGHGTARTYLTFDDFGHPASLGVALSESAMSGLPQTPMPGMPSAVMLMLELPAGAEATGFDHVMLDWNPAGHEPEHVYTLPHFDFHFYTITEAEQHAIMPTNPRFAEQASKLPATRYVPNNYVSSHTLMGVEPPAAAVPMMGLHWIHKDAPKLRGQTFTSTFIYGSYDGRFIFLEPMITKTHIESAKTVPGSAIILPVERPTDVERPGYYPARYTIAWNEAAKEYRISLDALSRRD